MAITEIMVGSRQNFFFKFCDQGELRKSWTISNSNVDPGMLSSVYNPII